MPRVGRTLRIAHACISPSRQEEVFARLVPGELYGRILRRLLQACVRAAQRHARCDFAEKALTGQQLVVIVEYRQQGTGEDGVLAVGRSIRDRLHTTGSERGA